MGTNVITADRNQALEKEKNLLSLELAEIKEISEIMIKKVEVKIQLAQALEASVDKKITELEQLIQRAEAFEKKMLVNEELAASLDKKKTDLELLIRRADALNKKALENDDLSVSLDEKILALQQFSSQSESLKPQGNGIGRHQEIVALSRKSLSSRDIAEVLDMPLGEVELILDISPHQP